MVSSVANYSHIGQDKLALATGEAVQLREAHPSMPHPHRHPGEGGTKQFAKLFYTVCLSNCFVHQTLYCWGLEVVLKMLARSRCPLLGRSHLLLFPLRSPTLSFYTLLYLLCPALQCT